MKQFTAHRPQKPVFILHVLHCSRSKYKYVTRTLHLIALREKMGLPVSFPILARVNDVRERWQQEQSSESEK